MLAASPMRAADSGPRPAVRIDPRTGKLVRREAVPRRANPSASAISQIVEQSARAHDVDPLLVHSIIQVESNYDPNAVSPKGAAGLMQLMPPTAHMLGVTDSFDPAENIEAGVKYLKYLKDLYKDDRLALAAYNAGPAAVDKYKWVPPYPETQQYVDKVGKRYGEAKAAAAKSAADPLIAPSPKMDAAPAITAMPEEKPPRLEEFVDQDGRVYLRTAP